MTTTRAALLAAAIGLCAACAGPAPVVAVAAPATTAAPTSTVREVGAAPVVAHTQAERNARYVGYVRSRGVRGTDGQLLLIGGATCGALDRGDDPVQLADQLAQSGIDGAAVISAAAADLCPEQADKLRP